MKDIVSSVNVEQRRVCVKTNRDVEFAKKVAQLALLEENIGVREFMTSLIFGVEPGGIRWFLFTW